MHNGNQALPLRMNMEVVCWCGKYWLRKLILYCMRKKCAQSQIFKQRSSTAGSVGCHYLPLGAHWASDGLLLSLCQSFSGALALKCTSQPREFLSSSHICGGLVIYSYMYLDLGVRDGMFAKARPIKSDPVAMILIWRFGNSKVNHQN